MNGQWIGTFYSKENNGHITLNLELMDGKYLGTVILIENNHNLPSFIAMVDNVELNRNLIHTRLSDFQPINPNNLLTDRWENLSKLYPNVIKPTSGTLKGTFTKKSIHGEWTINTENNGNFEINLSKAADKSAYQNNIMSWDEFKKHVSTLEKNRFIYRGQHNNKRLRSSYHRLGHSDLTRYIAQNVPRILRHVSSHFNKIFNLDNSHEYGALLHIAQHYGYPTPLLDWTRSPYIAAYFAFSKLPLNTVYTHIRIYIFDSAQWSKDTTIFPYLRSPVLTITPLELMPVYNNRAIPQQSVTTLTTVDDMETFISEKQFINNYKYLNVIDIPIHERNNVLNDLFFMGITAAALFPGLDGTFETLKLMDFGF